MMGEETVINVEDVSKKFCTNLKKSMLYGIEDITKNMIGLKTNPDTLRDKEFWALKDVSFEVKKGECLGIIGPNGSGKTTLLSLLNGIYNPDRGQVSIKGRVGALIAVGSGFHPLLTGAENIRLNAAILGMTKKEINQKFDDIVEFADIGDFLDTPMKNYSSGMNIRLGFAIAAHAQPDILLVDEVLAVGDVKFRNKCMKKMTQLMHENKCTMVFVSHNLEQIRNLADRVAFIENGRLVQMGDPNEVIKKYLKNAYSNESTGKGIMGTSEYSDKNFVVTDIGIKNHKGERIDEIKPSQKAVIYASFHTEKTLLNPRFSFGVRDETDQNIIWLVNLDDNVLFKNLHNGRYTLNVEVDNIPLMPKTYWIIFGVMDAKTNEYLGKYTEKNASFEVKCDIIPRGIVLCQRKWSIEKH